MITEVIALGLMAIIVLGGLYLFGWSVDNVLLALGIVLIVLLIVNYAIQKGYI